MVEWCRWLRKIAKAVEVFQVELNGHFSPVRIQEFAVYHRKTKKWWAWGIVVLTIVPCLVVPTVMDFAPLAPPSKHVFSNRVLFVREFIAWWIFSYLASYQASHFVPIFRISQLQLSVISTIAASGSIGCSFLAASIVIFPVPFSFVMIAPLWIVQVFSLVAITWGSRIRSTPEAWPQIVSLLKVWACQCCLVPVYPFFMLAMVSLPPVAQVPFACLLPGLRLLVRNWLSRALEHLRDEMSEVVILNADMFSALFVAYCMQTVPSLWAMGGLMAIDFCQNLVAIQDVNHFLRVIGELEKQLEIDTVPGINNSQHPTILAYAASRSTTVLLQAERILAQYFASPTARIKRRLQTETTRWESRRISAGTLVKGARFQKSLPRRVIVQKPKWLQKVSPLAPRVSDMVHATTHTKVEEFRPGITDSRSKRRADSAMVATALTPLEQRYVNTVGKLLFFTEFLILLNYVEVVIPAIYTASLLIMYCLPNRSYYGTLSVLDEQELMEMLAVVTGYCLLELLSLLLLMWAFESRLRVSAVVQLAFILEKQWDGVQVKFVFWVLYASQTLLQHFGYDFSFQFKWLRPG